MISKLVHLRCEAHFCYIVHKRSHRINMIVSGCSRIRSLYILKVLTSSFLKCSNIVNPGKSLVSLILKPDDIDRIIYKVPFDLIQARPYIVLSILAVALLVQ